MEMTQACVLAVPWENVSIIIKILLCCLICFHLLNKGIPHAKKKKKGTRIIWDLLSNSPGKKVAKEIDGKKTLLIIEVGGWVSWDALYYFLSYFDLCLGILY